MFPDAAIQGSSTGLSFPAGVDIDAQGRIYVPNQFGNSIAVFAADANGDATPVGVIAGAATELSGPGSVAVAPPLSIVMPSLPTATVGHVYDYSLGAALGTTPYRWSLRTARLPKGLSLTPSGDLTGVPQRSGGTMVRITVTDAGRPAMTASRTLSLVVRRAAE